MTLVVLVKYSGILTCLISFDRYLHMDPNVLTISKWRERAMNSLKRPQVYFILSVSAILAILISWYFYNALYYNEEVQGVLLLTDAILGFLGLSILSGLYFKGYSDIYRYVVKRRLHSNKTSGDTSCRVRYLQNLSKTVLLLVLTMLLTYLPFCIAIGIKAITSLVKVLPMTKGLVLFYGLCFLLTCSNGIFNSMIVVYRNTEATQWVFVNILRCGCREKKDAVQGQRRT